MKDGFEQSMKKKERESNDSERENGTEDNRGDVRYLGVVTFGLCHSSRTSPLDVPSADQFPAEAGAE